MDAILATWDPLSARLGLFVGLFLVAASSALVRRSIAGPLLTSIQNSPGIMHATAAVTAFAGGGLLVAHTDFTSLTAALVTLTAIWWALEGLVLLAFGHRLRIDSPASIRMYALSNILALIVGVFLAGSSLFALYTTGNLLP